MSRLSNMLRRLFARHRNGPTWYADEASSPFAVPNALEWLPKAAKADQPALGALLASQMRKIRPEEWTQLYRAFRHVHLRLADLPVLAGLPPDNAIELLGAASLNGNGFVRERALRHLADLGHARAVPYVLLRLGDWVQQVREEAERALRRLMDAGHVEPFLNHHVLTEHLHRVGRVDLAEIYAAIASHLRDPRHRPLLLYRLASADERQRLFIYRVLKPELEHDQDLVAAAAQDRSPTVRAWAAEFLAREKLANHHDLLRRLLRDRVPRVRLAVLQWLPSPTPLSLQDEVAEQIFADSRSVRDVALFLLRREGHTDVADRYRARLTSTYAEGVQPGWVAGLGETGQPTDLPLVRPFLHAPRSKVREAALRAAGRLDFPAVRREVLKVLEDRSSRVRRAAVTLLSGHRDEEIVARARRLMREGSEPTQWTAFTLLGSRDGWEVVPDILSGLMAESERIRQTAWVRLDDWYRRHQTQGWLTPDDRTSRALAAALQQVTSDGIEVPTQYIRSFDGLMKWIAEVTDEDWPNATHHP